MPVFPSGPSSKPPNITGSISRMGSPEKNSFRALLSAVSTADFASADLSCGSPYLNLVLEQSALLNLSAKANGDSIISSKVPCKT